MNEQDQEACVKAAFDVVCDALKKSHGKSMGAVLLVFPFDSEDGECYYAANAERQGTRIIVRDFLAMLDAGGMRHPFMEVK